MEHGDVLTRKQIQQVEIEVSSEYEEVCRNWLGNHGCSMNPTRPGCYLVSFPEGTHEEERLGCSGVYTRRYYIVLPSNVEISLYRASPVNSTQQMRVTMAFPREILGF